MDPRFFWGFLWEVMKGPVLVLGALILPLLLAGFAVIAVMTIREFRK